MLSFGAQPPHQPCARRWLAPAASPAGALGRYPPILSPHLTTASPKLGGFFDDIPTNLITMQGAGEMAYQDAIHNCLGGYAAG